MTDKKNSMLKKAFEEAAERELKNMTAENQIIVPFSKEHNRKMQSMFNGTKTDSNKRKRFLPVKRIAVCAAVLMLLVVAASITAGASFWDLFNPENYDNQKYTQVSWIIDGAETKGEGKDEFVEIEYDGSPVKIKYYLDTGVNSDFPERALVVLVNGVRQSFDAVYGEQKYDDIDILQLERGLGTIQYAELSFVPDTGKKGDVLALEISAIFDPDADFYPACIGEGAHSDYDADNVCDGCGIKIGEIPVGPSSLSLKNEAFARIIMKKNAPKGEDRVCEGFSGLVEADLNKKIYDRFSYEVYGSNGAEVVNEYDSLESLCAIFYKDIDESLFYDENGGLSLQTKLVTTAKQDDKYTINLHGRSGKYRVAFYIGTEPQPVFDGKEYVDVEIKDGKQVELNIDIDTTKLSGENNYSVVYKHIGENLFEDYWWFTEQTCEGTISVER